MPGYLLIETGITLSQWLQRDVHCDGEALRLLATQVVRETLQLRGRGAARAHSGRSHRPTLQPTHQLAAEGVWERIV
jgi:hypothetical protein